MLCGVRYIVGILVLAIQAQNSRACFCVALADESKICQADFAVRVTVLKAEPATIDLGDKLGNVASALRNPSANRTELDIIRYVVRVEDVYRLSRSLVTAVKPRSSNVTIVTSKLPCDVVDDLEVGGMYFVTGNLYEGRPGISRCTSVIAEYREGDVVPYRDNDMKVDVNPKCPEDNDDNERYMHLDAVEDYDIGDIDGGAQHMGLNVGFLLSLTITATTVIMIGV